MWFSHVFDVLVWLSGLATPRVSLRLKKQKKFKSAGFGFGVDTILIEVFQPRRFFKFLNIF